MRNRQPASIHAFSRSSNNMFHRRIFAKCVRAWDFTNLEFYRTRARVHMLKIILFSTLMLFRSVFFGLVPVGGRWALSVGRANTSFNDDCNCRRSKTVVCEMLFFFNSYWFAFVCRDSEQWYTTLLPSSICAQQMPAHTHGPSRIHSWNEIHSHPNDSKQKTWLIAVRQWEKVMEFEYSDKS